MSVTQISIGRFHHFHLARQLEYFGQLANIYTGYPRFKLKDEFGIPQDKIKSFPWIQTPYMLRGRFKLDRWGWLNREWAWQAHQTLDKYVASALKTPTTLVALSGSGLYAGKRMQELGGKFICDRGSSHIRYQDNLLREEYIRWGVPYEGIDPRMIQKEEAEYESSDYITVPSEFVRQSFITQGVPESKLRKIPYGAGLERFQRIVQPPSKNFRILFVGAFSLRKGALDLLQAYKNFKHPRKHLTIIGSISPEVRSFLKQYDFDRVEYLGMIPNVKLADYYSRANVLVLPSIEEGLAMVLGEAMACGCPIIASSNTGASDLFQHECEGFIVPIRQPDEIVSALEELASNPELCTQMTAAALERVKSIGGWNNYGEKWINLLNKID
jgi:glycosyltransferase involved in cell wall biosynthesis